MINWLGNNYYGPVYERRVPVMEQLTFIIFCYREKKKNTEQDLNSGGDNSDHM